MLRLKPFILSIVAIAAAIGLLGLLHYWRAGGRDVAAESKRQELAVGFLPVT